MKPTPEALVSVPLSMMPEPELSRCSATPPGAQKVPGRLARDGAQLAPEVRLVKVAGPLREVGEALSEIWIPEG